MRWLLIAVIFISCSPKPVIKPVIQPEKPIVFAPAKEETVKPVIETPKLVLEPIYETILFGFDSHVLSDGAYNKIADIRAMLHGRDVVLIGGTCDIGEAYYNDQLGLARAVAVKQAFGEDVVCAVESVGEFALMKTRKLSRRCEIHVKGGEK